MESGLVSSCVLRTVVGERFESSISQGREYCRFIKRVNKNDGAAVGDPVWTRREDTRVTENSADVLRERIGWLARGIQRSYEYSHGAEYSHEVISA